MLVLWCRVPGEDCGDAESMAQNFMFMIICFSFRLEAQR